ncbi:MAG: type I methionyl aminopeptidase [Opitutales bacterium]
MGRETSIMGRKRGKIPLRTAAEIQSIREACQVAASILRDLGEKVAPGVATYDLEQEARRLFGEYGAESPCFNYVLPNHPPFSGYICLSVSDEIVHGSGSMRKILREGDNVTVDVAVRYRGWIGDNAATFAVGQVNEQMRGLLDHTQKALYEGIAMALSGNRVGHVSHRIQKFVEAAGYSVVEQFVGHGVGRTMHEEPQVPNYGKPKDGPKLFPGVVIAIEPMVNMGRKEVVTDQDGWTARTRDGLPSAHFEHTVLVTEGEPEILTIPQK